MNIYDEKERIDSLKGKSLRFPMPSALCSYCLGETRIGEEHQMGNVRKIDLGASGCKGGCCGK